MRSDITREETDRLLRFHSQRTLNLDYPTSRSKAFDFVLTAIDPRRVSSDRRF